MCRWMAYSGGKLYIEDLLFAAKANLIDQSLSSRSAETPTNGDGFGVGWSQAEDHVTLGSVYYSFIIRNVRNPPNHQGKWLIGYNGIAEFFNPALTYFNTSIATPRASADPAGLTFFHRTRFKLYRTTNGAASWQSVLNTTPVLLRAGSHPSGVSPIDRARSIRLSSSGSDSAATISNARSAPHALASQSWYDVTMKSLRRTGTATAARTARRSSRLPSKRRSSVSTLIVAAPPDS